MKKLLSVLLAAALLMTLSAAAMADGIEKGTIVYGSSTELSGDWGREMWTNNAADKLVRELMDDYSTVASNQGGEFVVNPTIVKEMDSVVNEDGTKTFTVTINEGLVYNNGEPITAKDYVVESLFKCTQVAQDMGVMSALAETIVGGTAFQKGEAATVSGLRIVDEYTYSIQIVAEKLPYFYDLTYAAAYPMNVTYWFGADIDVADDGEGCYFTGDFTLENVKPDVEAARFATGDRVTAGPYNLVSFDKGSLQAILTINPNYAGNFEGVKPSIEKIVITRAEDATWADGIKTGAFNFFDTITDGDDINNAMDIVEAGGFGYTTFDRPGYGMINFQCDFGPTQFKAVRHAIAKLLDRNEFANTFCKGWGSVVNGPYGTGLWQFQDAEEWLELSLNTYEYDPNGAVELLVNDGWVYDETGADWTEGHIRHKKVTAAEAGNYVHNVTLADGTILMPLIIEWSSSDGNPVSELLNVMLAQGEQTAAAGMQINQNVMTFTELLNYYYRDASQGDKYAVPTYGMYNLASNFNPAYDQSYEWTLDPDMIAQGYNLNRLLNESLDALSMNMVYGVESDDVDTYMTYWKAFIMLWNNELPQIPLYSNVYMTVYPDWLEGYEQDSFWDFNQAILYCTVAE